MNKLLVQQGAAGDSPSSSVDDRIPDVGEDSRGASRIVGLQGDHRRTVEAGTQTGVSRQQGRGRCGEVEPVTGDREVQIAPAVGVLSRRSSGLDRLVRHVPEAAIRKVNGTIRLLAPRAVRTLGLPALDDEVPALVFTVYEAGLFRLRIVGESMRSRFC